MHTHTHTRTPATGIAPDFSRPYTPCACATSSALSSRWYAAWVHSMITSTVWLISCSRFPASTSNLARIASSIASSLLSPPLRRRTGPCRLGGGAILPWPYPAPPYPAPEAAGSARWCCPLAVGTATPMPAPALASSFTAALMGTASRYKRILQAQWAQGRGAPHTSRPLAAHETRWLSLR